MSFISNGVDDPLAVDDPLEAVDDPLEEKELEAQKGNILQARIDHGMSGRLYSPDFCHFKFSIGDVFNSGSYSEIRLSNYMSTFLAVKVVDRWTVSNEYRDKFMPREIEASTTLRHPNIIKIYTVHNYYDKTYIFMELLDRTLLEYISSKTHITQEEARYFFKQLLEALVYMHSFMVAHRDLKAENIMLDKNDHIKITDFGFVTKINEGETLSSTYCGSTSYACPEILEGLPYKPVMCDIWSAGCILFLLFTGNMPFVGSNRSAMLKCQKSQKFNYPKMVPIDPACDDLILKMLEPDVDKRWTSDKCLEHQWMTSGEA